MPKGKTTPVSREQLEDLYIKQGLSTGKIAKLFGVCAQTIANHLELHGIPLRAQGFAGEGPGHASWKGGIYHHPSGYVMRLAKGHPFAGRGGYVMEHRLVMEAHLGRYLRPEDEVHHKNENKRDNRIENLEVVSKVAHARHHAPRIVATARAKARLSWDQVQEIRTLWATTPHGELNILAKRFGIHYQYLIQIVSGKRRKTQ